MGLRRESDVSESRKEEMNEISSLPEEIRGTTRSSLQSAQNSSSSNGILVLGEDEEFAEKRLGKEEVGERFDLGKRVLGVVESWGKESLSDGRKLLNE